MTEATETKKNAVHRCPKCRSSLCSEIRKTAHIYQCQLCQTVFRLADKRETHTTDNREARPL